MYEVMKIIAAMFDTGIGKILALAAVGIIFWLIGRRKTDSDIHKTEIDAASVSIGILKGTIDSLRGEVEQLRSEVSGLKDSNNELKALNEKHLKIESENSEMILQMSEILCADFSCVNRCRIKIKSENGKYRFDNDR